MIQLIQEKLGPIGNLITFSKTTYRKTHPNNIVVFNSNLVIEGEKLWYGDLDITLSKNELIELSKQLNKTIYILFEMDGRFEHENKPNVDNYVVEVIPNGNIKIHKRLAEYYQI